MLIIFFCKSSKCSVVNFLLNQGDDAEAGPAMAESGAARNQRLANPDGLARRTGNDAGRR
jgi:hypothetical protein